MKWLNYNEWKAAKDFRHKQEVFLATFGCRVTSNTNYPISSEEIKWFNEEYERKYK